MTPILILLCLAWLDIKSIPTPETPETLEFVVEWIDESLTGCAESPQGGTMLEEMLKVEKENTETPHNDITPQHWHSGRSDPDSTPVVPIVTPHRPPGPPGVPELVESPLTTLVPEPASLVVLSVFALFVLYWFSRRKRPKWCQV